MGAQDRADLTVPDSIHLPTTMDGAVAYWLDGVEQVPAGERELNVFERARRHLERRGWSKFTFLAPDGRVSLPQALCDVMNSFEELREAQRVLVALLSPQARSASPVEWLVEFNEDAETTEIDVAVLLLRAARRP